MSKIEKKLAEFTVRNIHVPRREFMRRGAALGITSAGVFNTLNPLTSGEALAIETPELERNKIKCVKVGFTNCFLIPCDSGYLQIDVGYPGHFKKYLKGLDKLGIDISEIKYLLLTHHHDDHVGFATEFVKECGAKIIVHEKALEWLSRGVSAEDSYPVNGCVKFIFEIFSTFHKFIFPPVIPTADDFVIAGDDFELLRSIGIDADILHTPGHTDDSISVVMSTGTGSKIAFVGDVAMDFFNFCGCARRPIFVKDIEEVYGSWDRLKERGVRTIYPSHGGPFPAEELVRV